jgi:hypothetical protein
MAGYSGTPLVTKLGIKPGCRLLLLHAPPDFEATLGPLPDEVETATDLSGKRLGDVILFFTARRSLLENQFARLMKRLSPSGGLWISWPKKASGVETDLTEDVIREHALEAGLVDNKVCAIDDTWSGLRLVYRLKDRVGRKC